MGGYGDWEPVIGLEVHAQLLTRTKLFCGCETSFGEPPNTRTCPVCLGLPGALPVLNAEAVRLAALAAFALGCTVRARSIFARKNYFYPDLPKGYQISQYDEPLAVDGSLPVDGVGGPRAARIRRVHMEEDAGKNVHGVADESLVDLNRAGTPLIEIVGEPDLRSPAEARDYLRRLRDVLLFGGVCDGNLEQGSFRSDANVSVRRRGEQALGTRVEMKNINSFRFVEDALDTEIRRQIRLCERGERFAPETRGWDADARESYLLRGKELEQEYRYFPEPDLPPLVLAPAFLEAVRAAVPELPDAKRARWTRELGVTAYAAGVLSSHPRLAEYFEEVARGAGHAVRAASFIQTEVLRDVRTSGPEASFPMGAERLAELLRLELSGAISGSQLKDAYAELTEPANAGVAPSAFVTARGWFVVRDDEQLHAWASEIVGAHPDQAAKYRAGKTGLLGFFVGQLMKLSGGKADPKRAGEILRATLEGGGTSPRQGA
jgi:aspartyl-tRNA(Asn)/glutamyl-tRNA(Gln) amidotransferase subunit B